MRVVQFFDGAQSETTPTIGNIKASGLIEYANDAAYEAAEQGAPAEGNIYFNTTSKLIRYYNGTNWIDVVDRETAQAIDNKTIDGGAGGTNTVITTADNVEVTPIGNLVSSNAQDALEELQGDVDALDTRLDTAEADIVDLQNDKEDKANKGQPNGYASLDGTGKVPASQLPSYIDDVEEYANLASFPVTGEAGKIYTALDTNLIYRWTGSIYVEISPTATFNLDDLNDVVITTPTTGDKLTYDGSDWINTPDSTELNDLTDVVISSPVATEVLTYNGTDWVNSAPSSGSLDNLSDVTITPPAIDDIIKYNGSTWVNTPVSAPTIQRFTSGSGTYTTPANVKSIKIRMVGGGGGGGSTGTAGASAGGAGGNTTFGTFTAGGGAGGGLGNAGSAVDGGAGGTASGGANVVQQNGNRGHVGYIQGSALVASVTGGDGGNAPFFCGAGPGLRGSVGYSGTTNSGGGGAGGAGNTSTFPAGGGGSGAYIETIISSPSASYSYSVGAGGTGPSAGTSGFAGGAGGSGIIIVEEYYI